MGLLVVPHSEAKCERKTQPFRREPTGIGFIRHRLPLGAICAIVYSIDGYPIRQQLCPM